MESVKLYSSPVNRWRAYKATAFAVLYGLLVVICVSVLPFRTGAEILLSTNPLFAALAIWGFCFRRPL